jgi:hypothetical protein
MTLLRFASERTPAEAELLTSTLQECSSGALGALSVTVMHLSSASWKMQPDELCRGLRRALAAAAVSRSSAIGHRNWRLFQTRLDAVCAWPVFVAFFVCASTCGM